MYQFKKTKLSGQISVPSSKSLAHRALICAALSKGVSHIYGIDLSKDIEATIEVLSVLGAKIEIKEDEVIIDGIKDLNNEPVLNCYESGSTLRFLIPLVITFSNRSTWLRAPSLAKRPVDLYYQLFDKQGIVYQETSQGLEIQGHLKAGHYEIEGHISSQFISGLLFVLPLLKEDSYIELISPLQSKSYVDLTIDTLKQFNIKIIEKENGYFIKGNQMYKACDYTIEKDYSQAAFFLMAASNGHSIKVKDMNLDSKQGDRIVLDILTQMGCDYRIHEGELEVICKNKQPIQIDGQDIPDLICAVVIGLVHIEGISSIKHVERLKLKECDRLAAILTYLNQIGVKAWVEENTLYIKGNKHLKGGSFTTYHDHRMAMLLSMLALECEEDFILDDLECIHKSYPNYLKDYTQLGGKYHVINLEE